MMCYRFVERRQQALLFVRFQDDTGRVSPGTSGFVLAIRSQRVQQSTVLVHRRELVSQAQLVRRTLHLSRSCLYVLNLMHRIPLQDASRYR